MTTPVIPTLCSLCANIVGFTDSGSLSCKAFPDGIPDDILLGQFDHRFSHSKDNGILFDPNINDRIIKEGPFKEIYVKPVDLYKNNSIKMNYKCKTGTVDESNRCEKEESKKEKVGKKEKTDNYSKVTNTAEHKKNRQQGKGQSTMASKTSNIENEFKNKLSMKNVSLKGISLGNSSVILDTLDKENNKMPVVLEGIDNTPRMKGVGASLEPLKNNKYTLHVSARHIENEKNRTDASSYDGRIDEYEKAISDLNTQFDNVPKDNALTRYKIHKLIKEHEGEIRNLLDKKKSGEKFVPQLVKYKLNGDDRTRAEVLHEIGHYRKFNMDDELNDEIDNAFKNTDDFPSRYSRKNSDEWFSEQYVLYGMGMKHHPVVDSVMNKQLKKIKLV